MIKTVPHILISVFFVLASLSSAYSYEVICHCTGPVSTGKTIEFDITINLKTPDIPVKERKRYELIMRPVGTKSITDYSGKAIDEVYNNGDKIKVESRVYTRSTIPLRDQIETFYYTPLDSYNEEGKPHKGLFNGYYFDGIGNQINVTLFGLGNEDRAKGLTVLIDHWNAEKVIEGKCIRRK